MFKVISFDFGGTIAYEVKEDYVIYQQILNELGYIVKTKNIISSLEKAEEWWSLKRKHGMIWTEETFIQYIKQMLNQLSIPNDDLAVKIASLWPYKVELKAYDDVKPTLKELKNLGLKMIIISNVSSKRNLSIYLSRLGLLNYFNELIASGTVGYEKPNPKIYEIAIKTVNTPPNEIIHVGNDYKADYLGAMSVGIHSILLDRKGNHINLKCRRITNLTELLNYLK